MTMCTTYPRGNLHVVAESETNPQTVHVFTGSLTPHVYVLNIKLSMFHNPTGMANCWRLQCAWSFVLPLLCFHSC